MFFLVLFSFLPGLFFDFFGFLFHLLLLLLHFFLRFLLLLLLVLKSTTLVRMVKNLLVFTRLSLILVLFSTSTLLNTLFGTEILLTLVLTFLVVKLFFLSRKSKSLFLLLWKKVLLTRTLSFFVTLDLGRTYLLSKLLRECMTLLILKLS